MNVGAIICLSICLPLAAITFIVCVLIGVKVNRDVAEMQWDANSNVLVVLSKIFGEQAYRAYKRIPTINKRSKLWRLCYDLKNTQEYKIAHNDFKDIDEIVEHMPEYTREFILSKKPHLTEAYFNEKVKEMSKILRIKPLREVVFSDLLGDKGE